MQPVRERLPSMQCHLAGHRRRRVSGQRGYLRLRGLTRIALVTSTDTTGQEAERSVDEAIALPANTGVQIVDREHFNPTDLSADAQMTRVKAANAHVLIAWSTGSPAGTLLRAANDAGLALPVLTTFPVITRNFRNGAWAKAAS
jgi:ABC-type branched-subunit amino acid transport system substrate-binding protein